MINRFLIENKEQNPEYEPEERLAIQEQDEKRLSAMNYYCMTTYCLREYILRYFGEHSQAACGHCANCQREYIEFDVTEEAKKIISCIRECRGRYGINVIGCCLPVYEGEKGEILFWLRRNMEL